MFELMIYQKLEECWIAGFLLLGARCRNTVDVECVENILEKNLKHKIDVERLFASDSNYLPLEFRSCSAVNNIVLTRSIRRMLVLVSQSWKFNEPVLIIGETGCGKTTIAQMLAKVICFLGRIREYLYVDLISFFVILIF